MTKISYCNENQKILVVIKLMALVIAAVMVLGTVNFAFADDPVPAPTPEQISITGLEKDDSVQFYKILEWADDSAEAAEHSAVSGWYWTEPFATAFNVTTNGVADHGAAKLKAAINDNNELMISDTLAGEIARALNHTSGQTPVTVGDAIKVSADGESATYTFPALTNTDPATKNHGLYMAIITPAKQDTTYNQENLYMRLERMV